MRRGRRVAAFTVGEPAAGATTRLRGEARRKGGRGEALRQRGRVGPDEWRVAPDRGWIGEKAERRGGFCERESKGMEKESTLDPVLILFLLLLPNQLILAHLLKMF